MTIPSLAKFRHIHIVGACGTLMGAFAAFLKRQGVHVTGSDQNVYPPMSTVLEQAGVKIYQGFNPTNLRAEGQPPDLVVIGNVVRSDNSEVRAAIDGGMAYTSLPEFMKNNLLCTSHNIVVAGTHGKTTTTSLLAHVLDSSKKFPSYFMGGVSQDLPHSFHVSETVATGGYFVLEGDEYDVAFWDKVPKFNHYLPRDVILTSIEYDHADIYPTMVSLVRAFEGLIDRVAKKGRLIACCEYAVVRDMIERARARGDIEVITYGLDSQSGARYWPRVAAVTDTGQQIEVMDGDRCVEKFELCVHGRHNALNALAAWIECKLLGIGTNDVREALRAFRGVRRRQEVRGIIRDVTVIDDFAHHPTAVRETLRALKSRYPGHRLLAVFEPRSATSRRAVFQKEYALAFGEADCVFLARPYDQSRIPEDDRFSSDRLCADLQAAKKSTCLFSEVDEGVLAVATAARVGDVVAVLSNGGFGGFISKLLERLKAAR